MEEALRNVNDVVFAKSFQDATNVYTGWSETYDKDDKTLGFQTAAETAKMFLEFGMSSKKLLDLGGGILASNYFVYLTYYLNKDQWF